MFSHFINIILDPCAEIILISRFNCEFIKSYIAWNCPVDYTKLERFNFNVPYCIEGHFEDRFPEGLDSVVYRSEDLLPFDCCTWRFNIGFYDMPVKTLHLFLFRSIPLLFTYEFRAVL